MLRMRQGKLLLRTARGIFQKAAAAVKIGGALLFDVSTAYKLEKILGNEIFFEDYDDVTYFLAQFVCIRAKKHYNGIEFFCKEQQVLEGGQELYTRFDEKHEQYIHDFDRLKQLLCSAGFENIEIFDGYGESPVRSDSQKSGVCVPKKADIKDTGHG